MPAKYAANREKSRHPLLRRARAWLPLLLAAPIPQLSDTVAISGLTAPTVLRFAGDGQVFVAEKSGRVLRFDHLGDKIPELVADLRDEVHDYWDRGLLGLAIHPGFPLERSLFVFYTADAPPGQLAPFWGDTCPTPPGGTLDGCRATGRLSRLDLPPPGSPGLATETVLLGDAFCQQFPSHSVGSLVFGPDGALYASAGDGASFNTADFGPSWAAACRTARPRSTPAAIPRPKGAPCAARTCAPRPTRPAFPAPSCASIRKPAPHCPTIRFSAAGTAATTASSPTACATPSASRSTRHPASCGSATSAGTTPRSSTASPPRRTPWSRTSAGPATKAAAASRTTKR